MSLSVVVVHEMCIFLVNAPYFMRRIVRRFVPHVEMVCRNLVQEHWILLKYM